MFRTVLFLFYFLLVRFDFHLFVFYVEPETVVDTHILVGDPNYRKERDDIAPPIREEKFVPRDRENAQRDVVTEAILAGEQIEEFSAKVRQGAPIDDEEDYTFPTWAGVIPLSMVAGEPVDDPRLMAGQVAPEYAKGYSRNRSPRRHGDTEKT